MNLRHLVFAALAICVCSNIGIAAAQAPARVGEAAVVQNEVVRVSGSGGSQINVGDAVLRNETVRTGANSATRLVMIDSTNLSLGANSSITLDRTVFNDERSYRDVAIRLTTGAFRFVTGHSDKNAYKITTGLATIGVRGTTLDILSQRGRTTVVLQDGASRVCTLSFQCIELTQPGDTAVITSVNGQVRIQKTNNPTWTFAKNCAAAAGLCSTTQYAGTPTVIPVVDDGSDPTSGLCGR
ncbi:FecR domain-containing protein [Bradyrhizobium lablabi]|uniref:FecR family protein n=1 Tax=Bradyrhizobium lablabi TaxID=722472 RepID=UPI001BA6C3E3|nr:FecR family protein [Bradyrhizobium lablabi]MBR1120483.1 FecR domain-containing protein [Bradyrhizobium lablabi]